MINPEHLSTIISRTLNRLHSKEPAMVKLIKATFAVESNLTELYDGKKCGLMMMGEDRIDFTCKEHIRFKSNLKEWVHAATGIDVSKEDFHTICEDLQSNITFMVCVLYGFYDSLGLEMTDDSIESVWKIYRDHYNSDSKIGLDDFTQTYVDIYLN